MYHIYKDLKPQWETLECDKFTSIKVTLGSKLTVFSGTWITFATHQAKQDTLHVSLHRNGGQARFSNFIIIWSQQVSHPDV